MATYLLDTNILLRVAQRAAPESKQIRQVLTDLATRGDTVVVTPQNLIEFWAVATRPAEANGLGWDTTQTIQEIQRVARSVPILPDQPDTYNHWLGLVQRHDVKGKKVHDARLVAVMLSHGLDRILTLNKADFTRFTEVTAVAPEDVLSSSPHDSI